MHPRRGLGSLQRPGFPVARLDRRSVYRGVRLGRGQHTTVIRFHGHQSRWHTMGTGSADIDVPFPRSAINRNSGIASLTFDAEAPRVYELSMLSGGARLSQYAFDVRRV